MMIIFLYEKNIFFHNQSTHIFFPPFLTKSFKKAIEPPVVFKVAVIKTPVVVRLGGGKKGS